MTENMIRVGGPFFADDDITAIAEDIKTVLKSGWLTSGRVVEEFERSFEERVGSNQAVALNSCTAALHCLTSWAGIGPKDEVIVPANTFASTANAVVYVGGRPVFADSDPETFNVTSASIADRITKKTKAVIVVHIAGNPCEMDGIVDLCKERDLILFEDCAHALGSTYKDKDCGRFGVAGAYSFYPTKIMTTGEGGMIATDSKRLAGYARIFRNVGRATAGHVPVTTLGFNYRMTDIHACLGRSQIKRLDEFLRVRRELARIYDEELASIDWIEPQRTTDGGVSSYYTYICRLNRGAPTTRDELERILRSKGIETTVMFDTVYLQPYYAANYKEKRCPAAEAIAKRTIALPLHAALGRDDIISVTRALRSV
jgi:perosamine synthetase